MKASEVQIVELRGILFLSSSLQAVRMTANDGMKGVDDGTDKKALFIVAA